VARRETRVNQVAQPEIEDHVTLVKDRTVRDHREIEDHAIQGKAHPVILDQLEIGVQVVTRRQLAAGETKA
jgi:hypothetical protein